MQNFDPQAPSTPAAIKQLNEAQKALLQAGLAAVVKPAAVTARADLPRKDVTGTVYGVLRAIKFAGWNVKGSVRTSTWDAECTQCDHIHFGMLAPTLNKKAKCMACGAAPAGTEPVEPTPETPADAPTTPTEPAPEAPEVTPEAPAPDEAQVEPVAATLIEALTKSLADKKAAKALKARERRAAKKAAKAAE